MPIPRPNFLVRIAIALALIVGVLGTAASPALSSPGLAKGKHGQEHSGKSHAKPGKGHDNGKHKGEAKHKKDKDKEHHDNGKHKGEKRVAAQPIAAYTIAVDCTYDATTDQSSCQFDADNPSGGKKINLIDIPADELCAPVVGGDARFVDPDPNTGATGYRSTDPEGRFMLVFAGEVTAGGTATYWIKASDDIFPATGTGLSCGEEQRTAAQEATVPGDQAPTPASTVPATAEPTATAPAATTTPEVTDTMGSVVVQSYDCPIASPQADYDWYGRCSPTEQGVRYRLMRIDTETRDGLTTSTDDTGRATFRMLPPGTYQLTQAEGDWCYAQSDDVNADGNLEVKAGQRTTVWVFSCTGE